jgi:hypothetical protein
MGPTRLIIWIVPSFSQFTGSDIDFDYRLLASVPFDRIDSQCKSLRERFRRQTSLADASEEWMVRTHVSVKLLLSATVMLSSHNFAAVRRLRIVEPYLSYYSLFNASRALVFLVPEERWRDGALLEDVTHTKVINVTADQLRYLSESVADAYKDIARRALALREFCSYKFPAMGLKGPVSEFSPTDEEVLHFCRYIAEVAELYSECLEAEFKPYANPYGMFSEAPLRRFFEYEHKFLPWPIDDRDDYWRLGHLLRKVGAPICLQKTATDGLVEDFMAAWDFGDEAKGEYRPLLTDWDLIFPF